MHRTDGGAQWRKRPLDARLLAYAAHDVELIARVYRHYVTGQAWVRKGRKLEVLRAQSARYVALYGSREMKVRHEELGTARFMTWGWLTSTSMSMGSAGRRGRVCASGVRWGSLNAFMRSRRRSRRGGGRFVGCVALLCGGTGRWTMGGG